ncbi:glycosyltransferase [Riemerella anatipestifer]|uniref:glycosyltransferase n=1 Tax=Riemerella anatipestifer TaxID=34085 RepID=UPI0021F89521|nr:glycosyltransferase [Riemerella anatipestifer]MCW0478038.1 glycosyltransferase [Riemerella anatipestifer]
MSDKKKISILTLSMGHGGAEKVISLLLNELIKEYKVYLYLFYDNIHYDIPAEVHVTTVYKNNSNGLFRKIFSPFVVFRKYYKFLKTEKIQTSISFLFRANIINGMIKAKNENIYAIMSERNYPSKMYGSSFLRLKISKFFIKKYYNKADVLFSNSNYINNDLKDNFDVRVPIQTIYNPIIESNFIKKYDETDNVILKVVSVGRFDEVKNHYLLMRGVEKLESINLTIIGDGHLREQYIEYIKNNKLSEKVYLPGVSKTVLKDLINYDVFVLSSNSEGFPNSLLEAMSVGLPVISTNCMSGPLELLNEGEEVDIESGCFLVAKYGILINVGDVEALSQALLYLRDNIEVRKKMSEKSLERAKDFYIENIYSDFVKIVE